MYGELANYVAPKRKAVEKETVSEPPLSLEEAIKECITFLKALPDQAREKLLKEVEYERCVASIGKSQGKTIVQ